MICFNCGYKLPNSTIEKCPVCGVKFEQFCLSCGYPNAKFAKFCSNCGFKLKEEAEKNLFQETIKNIAVLFADVSGFTALSEKMSPDSLKELINNYFEYITKPVYQFEGIIDKYIGDCVMVVFGVKSSHIDDAKRAVLCAINMQKLSEEFSAINNVELKISVGIDYGRVAVGKIGGVYEKDFTVIGDVVNTAQRLQSNAGKGNILVSERVYNATKDDIHYSNPISLIVKNKENPVLAFSPIGIIYKSMLALDNLEERKNQLSELMETYTTKKGGIVLIEGHIGSGKSSFVKRFLHLIPDTIKVFFVSCNSLYTQRPYYLVSLLITKIMNIDIEAKSHIKKNRLVSFLDFLYPNYTEEEKNKHVNFLSLILGIELDTSFSNILSSMDYNDISYEIAHCVYQFINTYTKIYSSVIVIDDIHNADIESIEIIKYMNDKDLNAFSIITTLPNNKYLQFKDKIILDNLSIQGVENFIKSFLNCRNVDNYLTKVVFNFSQGNPLLVKESLSYLLHEKIIKIYEQTAILENKEVKLFDFNSILQIKFVSLSFEALEFIQVASVIGIEFNINWVLQIREMEYNPDIINQLVTHQIITFKESVGQLPTDKIYVFIHENLRQYLYNGISASERKNLHYKIAQFIENRYSHNLSLFFDILFFHYYNCENYKKALEYLYKIGVTYLDKNILLRSINAFEQYIEIAKKQRLTSSNEFVEVLLLLSKSYIKIAEYQKAVELIQYVKTLQTYMEHQLIADLLLIESFNAMGALKDSELLIKRFELAISENNHLYGSLMLKKATLMSMQANPEIISILKKANDILKENNDYENLAKIINLVALNYYSLGDHKKAIDSLELAYKYAEKINDLATMVKVLGNLGAIYHSIGLVSQAIKNITLALTIADTLSNKQLMCSLYINLGVIYLEKGSFNLSKEYLQNALDISIERKYRYEECIIYLNLGEIFLKQNNVDEAFALFNKSQIIAIELDLKIEEGLSLINQTKCYIKIDQLENAQKYIHLAGKIIFSSDDITYYPDYYYCLALIELKSNNIEAAQNFAKTMQGYCDKIENPQKSILAYQLNAEIEIYNNNYLNAIELINKSIELAKNTENHYDLAKGYLMLLKLYKAIKNDKISEVKNSLNVVFEILDECDIKNEIKEQLKHT